MARVVMDPAVWAKMDRVCERVVRDVTDDVHHDVLAKIPIATTYIGPERRAGGPPMISTVHATFIGDKQGQVWVGTDHWHYTEYGTAPHLITPNGNWPLRDRIRGKYFGFRVNHPGSDEVAYMRKSIFQKRRLRYVGVV